jgi:hypothetical protein
MRKNMTKRQVGRIVIIAIVLEIGMEHVSAALNGTGA